MIIFGWRGITYNKESGQFYCPSCMSNTAYRLKRIRNFFTLYFIPCIPLNLLSEYVECENCTRQFQKEVLELDPSQLAAAMNAPVADAKSAYFAALRRVMIEMMVSKGFVNEVERTEVDRAYQELAGVKISEPEMTQEIAQAQREPAAISALQNLATSLNERGKETVLFAAYRIAMADGQIADQEWALLAEVGEALAMTPSHINGAIAEAEAKYGRPMFD